MFGYNLHCMTVVGEKNCAIVWHQMKYAIKYFWQSLSWKHCIVNKHNSRILDAISSCNYTFGILVHFNKHDDFQMVVPHWFLFGNVYCNKL